VKFSEVKCLIENYQTNFMLESRLDVNLSIVLQVFWFKFFPEQLRRPGGQMKRAFEVYKGLQSAQDVDLS
jgi:hypothetical protein